MEKRNIKLIIAYDGTRYQGWQRLKTSQNTIQTKIESVLNQLTGETIQLIGSGRTDAGVHAHMQVANFHTAYRGSKDKVLSYLNLYLPEDIIIKKVQDVSTRFHSRYNVKHKTYIYRIWTGKYPPLFERKYVYPVNKPLDLAAMKEATALLVGEHDFQGFCSRKMKKSTVRNLNSIELIPLDNELHLAFTADGFLYHMVRNMVGTLLEVGLGKREVKSLNEILDTKDRSQAGERAPAKGLILDSVVY